MYVYFEIKTLMAYSCSNIEYADNYKKKKKKRDYFIRLLHLSIQLNFMLRKIPYVRK